MNNTDKEFDEAIASCKDIFTKKLYDYGGAWRIMRSESVTDQIFIKAKRIRSLEIKKESLVGEGIKPEFIGIVNYAVIGLIQLQYGAADTIDMQPDEIVKLYDHYVEEAKRLMFAKNHDYDEAWRSMRISSYTDLILMKINRTKEIEDHKGKTLISEGIDANYYDMLNYAVFGLIKIAEGEEA
ncbi:MAG: DUF1599 domain-containing protein [Paludibacteraceae bacterium]|nr:DUF1599 domain-containing protein [Paludibacteraceae bacterium]MBQ1851349.1 DUF1599 domain-containing protein [Paludibacteraceae bacterium]MBQ2065088.1 DUF1599 domain-containing protein [Paludibacteraceae bacterium]MBQ4033261.1 DUF1599 domain-containing protein [Paludibacteraceae bacterium]